ncbi:uncharacterized protein CLAFUR5_08990 [Fulvia fulva]|uniref:Xylanolytic transcriptional activator regulatory domain-containing protein n=1 Tax=Passalora fulva TaxID=5499 RepID=A0A9Q8PGB5_PASFU|nr:uncharacterized protein CLAFUR5_08990 [Fulvia fulva]UJO21958.1 hypothetical protein CLAFUR5_08990 [Fulvia fulva]
MSMIHTYIYLIHDRPHSVFHIPSLWRTITSRRIQLPLLLSLCAFGSRLSAESAVRDLAPELTRCAKQAVQSQLETVDLETIQACILIANICAVELEPSLETLYFGIATRMAQILGLHRTYSQQGTILQETQCRVWWTLVLADNWCSAGLGVPRQLDGQGGDVPMPVDEYVFQLASSDLLHHPPQADTRQRLLAHMIHLVRILGPVHELNYKLAQGDLAEIAAAEPVYALSDRLDEWHTSLPSYMRLEDANLDRYRAEGLGGPFVALHLGHHHYCTLLYFRYLDATNGPTSASEAYARRCKLHAAAFSELLRKSGSKAGCEAVYATVGHMTVVSSAVHLHTLLLGEASGVAQARADLTSNFAALIELKKYWPCLEHLVGRLLIFQKSCLATGGTNTHKVDKWMTRFLIEHSRPVEERVDFPQPQLRDPEDVSPKPIDTLYAREHFANQALASLWQA